MNRFKISGRQKGQLVYLISSQWFNAWRIYTQYEVKTICLSVCVHSSVS